MYFPSGFIKRKNIPLSQYNSTPKSGDFFIVDSSTCLYNWKKDGHRYTLNNETRLRLKIDGKSSIICAYWRGRG